MAYEPRWQTPTSISLQPLLGLNPTYSDYTMWNSLTRSIIRSNNIRTFKRLLKSYLIILQNSQLIICNLLLIIRWLTFP